MRTLLYPKCTSVGRTLPFIFVIPVVSSFLVPALFSSETLWGAEQSAWPTNEVEIAAANSVSPASMEDTVNAIAEPAQLPRLKVGEFRFTRLEPGKVHLIATVDASGRELYFSVIVISPPGTTPRFVILNSAPPHLLASELLDLDGKGVDVLITKELVAAYQGSANAPLFWYSIHRMNSGLLEDVSAVYPQFYRAMVLPVAGFVESALSSRTSDDKQKIEKYIAEATYLQFKYQRVVDGKTKAGLEAAVEWEKSDDPDIQMLAVKTFTELSLPRAIAGLEHLTRAPNFAVSQAAKMALDKKAAKKK